MIFTENAAEQVQKLIVDQNESKESALRVFVQGG